ncbi:1-phosphofructokinase [Guptibacillus algicola]|uniref:1-phosphofructokinase n=1 Tax=Guptibacillus algicola TaxID=225844 RepID=UPI001CD25F71|nr:1-phosphofructokinase [Alkalihalobacillus algicola]MCA0986403.1 1-phosphofructokinase [Alkalihalobacillus algicola]
MIYTVTLNPSVDYIVGLANFEPGQVNIVDHDKKFAGGKGVNVSRVLHNLGFDSKVLGFVGGFTGEFIETALKEEGLSPHFIKVDGDTRINIKLKAEVETEINGQSPDIDETSLETLYKQLSELYSGDIVVLAGSVPASVPSSIYSRIIESLPEGVEAIVDTKGAALKEVIRSKPFLVKPNHHELGEFFGVKITSIEEATKYGRELRNLGAQNVIISLAEKGAVFLSSQGDFVGNAPKGEVKNSVGAGDSVVAGFLSTYLKTRKLKDGFHTGIAAGSASAFSNDFCTKEDIETLRTRITVRSI